MPSALECQSATCHSDRRQTEFEGAGCFSQANQYRPSEWKLEGRRGLWLVPGNWESAVMFMLNQAEKLGFLQ